VFSRYGVLWKGQKIYTLTELRRLLREHLIEIAAVVTVRTLWYFKDPEIGGRLNGPYDTEDQALEAGVDAAVKFINENAELFKHRGESN